MKATDFDKLFDDGEDITPYLDWSTARRPNQGRQGKEWPSGRQSVPQVAAKESAATRSRQPSGLR